MEVKKPSGPLGAGLVVLSSLFYASYGIWIKLTGDFFGDFTQAVLRSVIVVALLLPFAVSRKQVSRLYWRRDVWPFAGLLVSTALISMPLFYAIKIIGVGLGIAVTYAGIVLGAFIFGRLFNGEQYTKDKWLSTILGIVGLWLVFTPSTQTFGLIALLAALVSGLASGLNMVVSKIIKYSPMQTTILTWAATIVTNLPMIFILNESWPPLGADIHWLYLFLFSLSSLISSSLLIKGLKLIETGAAGILGLLEIVFGVFFGIFFFKEQPSLIVIVGMGCIMIAAAIPYLQYYKKQEELLN